MFAHETFIKPGSRLYPWTSHIPSRDLMDITDSNRPRDTERKVVDRGQIAIIQESQDYWKLGSEYQHW